jgi:hypothetical protein
VQIHLAIQSHQDTPFSGTPTDSGASYPPGNRPATPPVGAPLCGDMRLAWSAGFIDGDGCITAVVQTHAKRSTPSCRIRVIVQQNDHYTLTVLKDYLGERGALNAVKRQPYHNRQVYQLQYDGKNALAVIRKILPYLVRKRPEAEACLLLAEEGKVSTCPGPNGFPKEVHERRAYWINRIRRMK